MQPHEKQVLNKILCPSFQRALSHSEFCEKSRIESDLNIIKNVSYFYPSYSNLLFLLSTQAQHLRKQTYKQTTNFFLTLILSKAYYSVCYYDSNLAKCISTYLKALLNSYFMD